MSNVGDTRESSKANHALLITIMGIDKQKIDFENFTSYFESHYDECISWVFETYEDDLMQMCNCETETEHEDIKNDLD